MVTIKPKTKEVTEGPRWILHISLKHACSTTPCKRILSSGQRYQKGQENDSKCSSFSFIWEQSVGIKNKHVQHTHHGSVFSSRLRQNPLFKVMLFTPKGRGSGKIRSSAWTEAQEVSTQFLGSLIGDTQSSGLRDPGQG